MDRVCVSAATRNVPGVARAARKDFYANTFTYIIMIITTNITTIIIKHYSVVVLRFSFFVF